jgi:hypothetical protein
MWFFIPIKNIVQCHPRLKRIIFVLANRETDAKWHEIIRKFRQTSDENIITLIQWSVMILKDKFGYWQEVKK